MAEASKQTMDLRFATHRGPRGGRRDGRRRSPASVGVADAAGAGDQPGPASSARTARASSGRGTRRSTPRPRSSRPRHGCWTASEATTAPTVRRSALARVVRHSNGRAQPPAARPRSRASRRRVARWTCSSVPRAPARRPRCARFVRRGSSSTGRGASSVWRRPPTAAQALADDLGIACDNTAKWLHEYDHGRTELRAGQLVIIDEATLAGTTTLDRISGIAAGRRRQGPARR